MTRQEVLAAYDVDASGRITTPGQFESEMLYAPALYESTLDGCAEELRFPNDQIVYAVPVDSEDRVEWPELPTDTAIVAFEVSETGFVSLSHLTEAEYTKLEAECEEEWAAATLEVGEPE